MKMKNYIWMMAAAVFGLAACQDELEEIRLVDPSQVVAPVLHELPEEIVITADNMSETVRFEWDKADFGQPVQYAYTIFGSTDGGSTLVRLYPNLSSLSQEVSYEAFNQLVTTDAAKGGLGLVAGESTEVIIMVGATVGSNYQTFYSNPRTILINPTEAERVYETVWLPGSANGWDHGKAQHLFCYAEDGNTFVGVTDFGTDYASNQFKLTGAAGWSDDTGNWGMADPSAAPESASITLLNGSNDNITIYTAHRYYHFTFTKKDLGLKMDKGFDQVGIIGLNGDWNTDIVMTLSNDRQLFYADIDVAAATEFKFRLDGGWDTNWGGALDGLTGGGDNIPVEAGQYRVYLNLNDWNKPTAKLDASMYGKPEEVEPEPEPEPAYVGWGIIGDFNAWGGDAAMTENDGVWTGYVTLAEDGTLKLRKDADWNENYGGTFVTLGEPFEAVAGGDNISLPAGFYQIVLNLNDTTITVSEGNVWSLIGAFNSWGGDVDMTLSDGKWVSPATHLDGEFKLRHNHDWDANRGGTFEAIGKAFEAVAGGDNINVPAGDYVVTYDPEAETITIDGALPQDQWALIGVGGDWSSDIYMRKLASGLWVSNAVSFSGEFKLRFNNGWDVNRGGSFEAAGKPFTAVPDGDNINLPEGKWQIIYNPALETITVNDCAQGWSVVGELEGTNWDFDLFMAKTADNRWESETFQVTGAVKIRFDGGWDDNRGGTFESDGEAFAVTAGGANISVGDSGKNQFFKLVYDAAAETITLKQAWCLIGEVEGTSWSQDFAMTETSADVWEGAVVVNGGFKIRKSGNWDINRGAPGDVEPYVVTLGEAFTATAGGKNLGVSESGKKYKVVYNATGETLTVSAM